MKKRTLLIISIILTVVGFASARIGDSLSVVDNGTVIDSALMPIGAILFMLGLLGLAVTLIWFLISFIKGKLKKGE